MTFWENVLSTGADIYQSHETAKATENATAIQAQQTAQQYAQIEKDKATAEAKAKEDFKQPLIFGGVAVGLLVLLKSFKVI